MTTQPYDRDFDILTMTDLSKVTVKVTVPMPEGGTHTLDITLEKLAALLARFRDGNSADSPPRE
jgi:hypothetical protein